MKYFSIARLILGALLVFAIGMANSSNGLAQKKKGKKPIKERAVDQYWFKDSDGTLHLIEEDPIEVPTSHGEAYFTTSDDGVFGRPTHAWFRHYPEVKAEGDLPAPDSPLGPKTPIPASGAQKVGPFSVCLNLDGGVDNNTYVMWVRYLSGNKVLMVRRHFYFQANLTAGVAVVRFNGLAVRKMKEGLVARPKVNRLQIITSKVDGRSASQVYVAVVPNKNIPVEKMPRQPTKNAAKATGLVLDRKVTRHWNFPKVELPSAKGKAADGFTIMCWALYVSKDHTRYYRHCFYVKGAPGVKAAKSPKAAQSSK